MPDERLVLPDALRPELKAPLGPVYTDAGALLGDVTDPLVTVGDVVTYHVREAGRVPAVGVVDERTEREPAEDEILAGLAGFDREVAVANPAGTLTGELVSAIVEGVAATGTTLVWVSGEEDLATLPAILAVPTGGSVVYGQPDEGMVLVTADGETRRTARSLLERMEGPGETVLAGLDSPDDGGSAPRE